MWYHKKFFERIVALILILLAAYLIYALNPILGGIMNFLLQVLLPFFLSLILYYLLRPLVQYLQHKIGLIPAIIFAFALTGSLLVILGMFIYPAIVAQVQTLKTIKFHDLPPGEEGTLFDGFGHLGQYISDEVKKVISSTLSYLHIIIVENITLFLSVMTQFVFTMIMVPFMLFYMLKDGKKIQNSFLDLFPAKYKRYVKSGLVDCDHALFQFINGRVVIAAITATLLYISFLFIGIDYIVVLTLTSFIFYIIPTIGNFLSMILPLIVGFSMSAWIGLQVLIAMVIVSSLEGFLISTLVMGATLYIHPITLLIILTAAGSFYGIFGLLFGAPIYVIGKIVFLHIMQFRQKRKIEISNK